MRGHGGARASVERGPCNRHWRQRHVAGQTLGDPDLWPFRGAFVPSLDALWWHIWLEKPAFPSKVSDAIAEATRTVPLVLVFVVEFRNSRLVSHGSPTQRSTGTVDILLEYSSITEERIKQSNLHGCLEPSAETLHPLSSRSGFSPRGM